MTNASETLGGGDVVAPSLARPVWPAGLIAAVAWAATAVVTVALPDVVPWGSAGLFAALTGAGAAVLLALAFTVPKLGSERTRTLVHYGPWLVAIGVWFFLWELTTAKFGWLPKPFFSPPHGLLAVYVAEWQRLLICIAYSLRLWALGFFSGVAVGFVLGVARGWSARFSYWGHAGPEADRPGAGDGLDPRHLLFLPDHLPRLDLHRRAGGGHSGGDPDGLGRARGEPVLLRRRPHARRRQPLPGAEGGRAGLVAERVRGPVHGALLLLRRARRRRDARRQIRARLVHPVPDGLFRLRQRLRHADHHGPPLRGSREAAVRRPRPAARLAEGIL